MKNLISKNIKKVQVQKDDEKVQTGSSTELGNAILNQY